MITKSAQTLEYSCGWQQALSQAIRDPAELLRLLQLPENLLPGAIRAAQHFPLRVPLPYLQRIEIGNPHDPLLRQILPLDEENQIVETGHRDPVDDLRAMPVPGLLHKYHGRALLVTTGACGIHCRYCFRRHFPYNSANPIADHWDRTLDYLASHPEINEVILSGGDPLSLTDHKLAAMWEQLQRLPGITTVRLHTRLPIVLPERITDNLLAMLEATAFRTVLVTHINHPNEIDADVINVMRALKQHGVHLLNQSVLLAGVNDDVETLHNLSHCLFKAGILPYYLHQFDPVQGAMHFAVSVYKGRKLLNSLRSGLPGYLVPRYVQEISGSGAKIPL